MLFKLPHTCSLEKEDETHDINAVALFTSLYQYIFYVSCGI